MQRRGFAGVRWHQARCYTEQHSAAMDTNTEIPKRAFFKAAEVCSIVGVQPYVLKSWAAEFPSLSGKKRKNGSRVYGRGEVELVLRIKELLYVDGLTLGAARRKLLGQQEALEPEADASLDELVGEDVRERLAEVKRGLRSILALLSGHGDGIVEADEAKPAARRSALVRRRSVPREAV